MLCNSTPPTGRVELVEVRCRHLEKMVKVKFNDLDLAFGGDLAGLEVDLSIHVILDWMCLAFPGGWHGEGTANEK